MMKAKPSELIYKFILCLLIVDAALYATTINNSFKNVLHNLCLVGVIVFALLCILLKQYTIKFFILNVVIFLFAIVSYKTSGNTDIFTSILLVMLAWRIDIDDILKMIFSIRFIVFISVVLLSLMGVLERGSIALTSADKGVLFGYGHANTFAGNAGILIFLMLAINRANLKGRHFITAIIADFLIFFFSRSRTSLLLLTMLIVILLMCKYYRNLNKIILNVVKYIQPILLVIVFSLVYLRSKGLLPGFIDLADKVMNGRILLASMNLDYYPITFLGQKVDLSLIALEHSYYALDNGFVYILIHYGILGLFVISGLQQKAIMECVKQKDVVLSVICILILCWMVYEGMMVSATSNFTLLFSVALLETKKLNSKERKRRT